MMTKQPVKPSSPTQRHPECEADEQTASSRTLSQPDLCSKPAVNRQLHDSTMEPDALCADRPNANVNMLLIIEDDQSDIAIYRRMFALDSKLASLFERVVYVSTFIEAEDCIAAGLPACCLMDFQLPEGRASDFIERLHCEGLRFPIVISTGVGCARLAVELMQLGVQDYLTKDDLRPAVLARTLRNAMTTFQLESEIYYRAHYDGLTGLCNRVTFLARLRDAVEQARRYQRRLCLLYVDVDRFKQVNDEYGHDCGDALLTQVASRMRACIRQTDMAARLGGDEFVLLLLEADVNQGLSVAEKLFAAMAEPVRCGVEDVFVTLSIGVADFPASASDEKELVAHADVALYKAKARGRAQFATFSQEDVIAWREQKLLKKMLPQAIAQNQLVVRYVPLFDVRSGECALVAASLHWETPSLCLANEQIFALASEDVVQHALSCWLVARCLDQLTLWRQAQPKLGAVLPFSSDFLQQRGVQGAIGALVAAEGTKSDRLHVPAGSPIGSPIGSSGGWPIGLTQADSIYDPWGLRPLMPLRVGCKSMVPKGAVTLLDIMSDQDCQFCQVSAEVFMRPLEKGIDALLNGLSALGDSLGVTILSAHRLASLRQVVDALASPAHRAAALVYPQPLAPCDDWQAFLTKSMDHGAGQDQPIGRLSRRVLGKREARAEAT